MMSAMIRHASTRLRADGRGVRACLGAVCIAGMLWPNLSVRADDYEPFAELPPEILEALQKQGLTAIEYVAVAMSGRIITFRVGEVEENEIEESTIGVGEYVVPGKFGFDFAKEEDGFHVVVLSTASPGSGNDCRRGGTCKEAQR